MKVYLQDSIRVDNFPTICLFAIKLVLPHIEVRDLPFHRIPFVNCFISLIDNKKKRILLKRSKQNCDNFCGSKFTGQQSCFSFAYYASFDAQPCPQPRAVCA